MANRQRLTSTVTVNLYLGDGESGGWTWLHDLEEVLRRLVRGELPCGEDLISYAEAQHVVNSISALLRQHLEQDFARESLKESAWAWAPVVSAAAQQVLRASSRPGQPHAQKTVTKLLLLASAEAGLPFVCPGEAGWLKLYFEPLQDEGCMARARWLENGESINRPFDSVWNRCPDHVVRLDRYVSADKPGAVRAYGLTAAGRRAIRGELVRQGLDEALLTSMAADLRAHVTVPPGYPAALQADPDEELERQMVYLSGQGRKAGRAGRVNA